MTTTANRIGQSTGPAGTRVRIVDTYELPEVSVLGQLLFVKDQDRLMVHDGDGWQTVGDGSLARTFVGGTDPALDTGNAVVDGDVWINNTTNILSIRVSGAWVAAAVPANSVGTAQLQANSITAKHTLSGAKVVGGQVIGTTIFTADTATTSNLMAMGQDANGGFLMFYYGVGEGRKGLINPQIDAGRPKLVISSGTMSNDAANAAILSLFGGYAEGAGKKAEFNCTLWVQGTQVSSSLRYKENVVDLPYSTEQLLALRPVLYTREGQHEAGFIAEEADELGLGNWVGYLDETPEAFSYQSWTAALQKVCRDQQAQIDALTARLEALEARHE